MYLEPQYDEVCLYMIFIYSQQPIFRTFCHHRRSETALIKATTATIFIMSCLEPALSDADPLAVVATHAATLGLATRHYYYYYYY